MQTHFMTLTRIFVLTTLLFSTSVYAAEENPRTISVSGVGKVTAPPDMAWVQTGVVTEAATASDALSANTKAMTAIMQLLHEMKIADKDIQTINFNVQPKYHYDRQGNKPPKIVGYSVSNSVRVEIHQLDSLGGILDKLIQAGSNQVSGIGFDINDKSALQNEARRLAFANAKAKAELYADAANVDLESVLSISEGSVHTPRPRVYADVGMARMAQESSVPIASGENEIQVNVSVVFAID